MAVEIRPCASVEEFMYAGWGIGQYFGAPISEERAERFLRNLELERMHGAWEDGAIVGGAGAFTFDFSVPGGDVRTSGITVVGVYPTHRRRGVLRAMMRAQLDEAHERGEPLSALWASEETIYGRFGYGLASWAGQIKLPRDYGAFVEAFERRGRIRFVEPDEALELFPPVHEAMRSQRPGMFRRKREWWEFRVLFDPEDRRNGGGPKRFVVHELDGEVTGYAIYRHHPGWEDGVSTAKLNVIEAMAPTPEAMRELWRYLLDVDWVATIEAWPLPPDHPLFLLLATPRRAHYVRGDSLWVRIVDVGAALSQRSYRAGEPIVFEVRDAFCPWNEGRWRLADGNCERTEDDPDLRLDADALGSAYLGGVTFAQLAAALRLAELSPGAAERADDVFHVGSHPWCPEIF